MKTCTMCGELKSRSLYFAKSDSFDGLQNECKVCNKSRTDAYSRTRKGFISKTYSSQKLRSKRRGHDLPSYTKEELFRWAFSQSEIISLWDNWVKSGYRKGLRPSIDRIDDSKHYSFDNVQLMTWDENDKKGKVDIFNGVNDKHLVSVDQLSKEGCFLRSHHSLASAARYISKLPTDILLCCRGDRLTAYGFKWRYAQ
jgi:hypothetical protein